MQSSEKLREQIASKIAEAQAIVAVAEQETRDLSAEEKTQIDNLTGENGVVDQLQKDLERVCRIEAKAKEILANKPMPGAEGFKKQFAVPKRHGKLKAFKSDEDAYASGKFLQASLLGDRNAIQWCNEHGIAIQNVHSTTDNSKGGVLVPDVMESAIINLREEYGVARRSVRVWPMSSMVLEVPRRSSGFTAYFVGENSQGTESDLAFSQIRLDAKKLMIMTRLSMELNDDSIISLADLVAQESAWSLAEKEDQCCFNGDGTSTYGGIVGLKNALLAGSTVTAATGDQTFADLLFGVFEDAIGKLPRFPGIRPAWYMHSAGFYASAARLMDAAGGNTIQTLQGGVSGVSFLGYPVVFTQVLENRLTGTNGLVFGYFGDLSMAVAMGSRSGIEVSADASRYFEYDQLAIRVKERFDINVHETGTATAAGPVVALKFAA